MVVEYVFSGDITKITLYKNIYLFVQFFIFFIFFYLSSLKPLEYSLEQHAYSLMFSIFLFF